MATNHERSDIGFGQLSSSAGGGGATFSNPILPGFHPDPSICRGPGESGFYLITSSFEFFPGVPIFHSRDLVNWRPVGHVLDRPSQLDLDGIDPSQGVYAPTIRYHAGRYYMVTTVRGRRPIPGTGTMYDDNIICWADDPEGDWSEPTILIKENGIIDPSLFFDDDDKVYYMANARAPAFGLKPEDAPYAGWREIWMQELDLDTMSLVGDRMILWNGALRDASTPEAPHIYKLEGVYYLLIGEAGTFHDHAVTIARSASGVRGPYEGSPRNPILTHRHLGLGYPITNAGHADLVETNAGEWWMVALASRPVGGYYYNLGRETFLTPVAWEDGWPVVNPGHGVLLEKERCPALMPHPWPTAPACDRFADGVPLAPHWNFLRTPREPSFHSLSSRPGWLRLELRPESIADCACPSMICRRQQHICFAARTTMEFQPLSDAAAHTSATTSSGQCAGLVLFQGPKHHFQLVQRASATDSAEVVVELSETRDGKFSILGTVTLATSPEGAVGVTRVYLKVEARGQAYSFFCAAQPEAWHSVACGVDGRLLSTQAAGGFIGAYMGLYASSNGEAVGVHAYADFESFEYQPLTGGFEARL